MRSPMIARSISCAFAKCDLLAQNKRRRRRGAHAPVIIGPPADRRETGGGIQRPARAIVFGDFEKRGAHTVRGEGGEDGGGG